MSIKKAMPPPPLSNKPDVSDVLDKYLDKVAKQFGPTAPTSFDYQPPKPVVFQHWTDIAPLEALANEIMDVLSGHTIEDIVNASKIVEVYVAAQSKGSYFLPTMRMG